MNLGIYEVSTRPIHLAYNQDTCCNTLKEDIKEAMDFIFFLLEKLATLAPQMAATLQLIYLLLTAYTASNVFLSLPVGKNRFAYYG